MRANSKRHFSLFSGPLNSFVKKAAPKIVVLPGRAMQTAALHDFYKELVSLAKTPLFPPERKYGFFSVRKGNFLCVVGGENANFHYIFLLFSLVSN